jgi:electron transfer flavoprotein beta subunit
MGCDDAVLVSDRAFAGSDTWSTSYVLAKAIEKIGPFDIILCGKQASDGDTAQVGPGIATHLDLPQVTYVKKIEEIEEKSAKIERLMEEGFEIIETPLPCLLTVVKEINEPRLPSFKGKIKAKKADIKKLTAQEIAIEEGKVGLNGSPTRVVKIFSPPARSGGQILEGEPKEVAERLVELLKDEII